MKLTCPRKSLSEAFTVVSMVVPSRTPKEILKNVKLVVEPGKATLMATDLEISLSYQVMEVSTDSSGEVLIPTSRMMSILREVTSEEIEIDANDDKLTIRCGTSEFRLPQQDALDFPELSFVEEGSGYMISAKDFSAAIKKSLFATDAESTRYALGGVHLDFEGEKITFAATDSRRLATCHIPSQPAENAESTSMVVPRKAMQLIERSLPGDDSSVELIASSQEVVIKAETWSLTSRLLEGRFPNYRDVLPQESSRSIELIAKPLLNVVRQSQIVTNDESRGVDFVFSSGTLILKSQAADVGESKIELPIGYDGDEVAILFDPRYVEDFLKVLESEANVTLKLNDSEDPALFQAGEDYQYVVMPLARND